MLKKALKIVEKAVIMLTMTGRSLTVLRREPMAMGLSVVGV